MNYPTSLILLTVLASCLPALGGPKITAKLKVLSATTGQEVTTVRVGDTVKIVVEERDLHLVANKNVTLNYVLSVVPTGISTPITLSGKVAGKLTNLPDDGGAAQTTQDLAPLAGTQSAEGAFTVPDSMPVGTATMTVTLAASGVGSVSVKKSIKITL